MGSRKQKVMTSIAAIMMIAVLALAGTFAWSGEDTSDGDDSGSRAPEVRLHDDYDKTGVDPNAATLSAGERYRKVYVENMGDVNLYIRVKLNEYMQKNGHSVIAGTIKGNKATWPARYSDNGLEYSGTDIDKYVSWNTGAGTATTPYVKGWKNNYLSTSGTPADAVNDPSNSANIGHTPASQIYTMKEYNRLTAKPTDGCWILDEDGYAYWSKKLTPDNATGMLLHTIAITPDMDESYYYGLRISMEAVTISDLEAWLNGTQTVSGKQAQKASANAAALLKEMSGEYTKITPAMRTTNPSADAYDQDKDGFLDKKEYQNYQTGIASMTQITADLRTVNAGETITINGKEWIVLTKDTATKQAELLSKTLTTKMQYHVTIPYMVWSKSDVHAYLNNDYYNSLSPEFQSIIKDQAIDTIISSNASDPPDTTTDKVYMLSENPIFSGIVKTPSGYQLTTDQCMCSNRVTDDGFIADDWLLRSPRQGNLINTNYTGAVRTGTGGIRPVYVEYEYGIRPAVTVVLP